MLQDFLFLRFLPKLILTLAEVFQMTLDGKLYERKDLINAMKNTQNTTKLDSWEIALKIKTFTVN